MPHNLLILAGTPEARLLAEQLSMSDRYRTLSSFAGLVKPQAATQGQCRFGGFGGVSGFRDFVQSENINIIINATHPFSSQMSATVRTICCEMGIPWLRLIRPAWQREDEDRWIVVDSMDDAVAAPPAGSRVLVTMGRNWQPCLSRTDIQFIVRMMVRSDMNVPDHIQPLVVQPPYDRLCEEKLFARFRFTHLITKNAGGSSGLAKLEVARANNCQVLMIDRPLQASEPMVDNPNAAFEWLESITNLNEVTVR